MQGDRGWPVKPPSTTPKIQCHIPGPGYADAIDFNFVHHFPAHKGLDQPGQTQDVIQMAVRSKRSDFNRFLKPAPARRIGAGYLPTINQEAIFIMLDYNEDSPRCTDGAEGRCP